jgi:hypothetical protein
MFAMTGRNRHASGNLKVRTKVFFIIASASVIPHRRSQKSARGFVNLHYGAAWVRLRDTALVDMCA